MGALRVVVLDAIDPQMRAYLIDALKRPIAVNPAGSGYGIVWGLVVLVVGAIAVAMHMSNLEGGSPPGDFYSPITFSIATGVVYFVGALIIGGIQRSRSLRRLPQQGTFAVGTNIVIASERVHTVYSFAEIEKLDIASAGGPGGLILIIRIAGITWNFRYGDRHRVSQPGPSPDPDKDFGVNGNVLCLRHVLRACTDRVSRSRGLVPRRKRRVRIDDVRNKHGRHDWIRGRSADRCCRWRSSEQRLPPPSVSGSRTVNFLIVRSTFGRFLLTQNGGFSKQRPAWPRMDSMRAWQAVPAPRGARGEADRHRR